MRRSAPGCQDQAEPRSGLEAPQGQLSAKWTDSELRGLLYLP